MINNNLSKDTGIARSTLTSIYYRKSKGMAYTCL